MDSVFVAEPDVSLGILVSSDAEVGSVMFIDEFLSLCVS